MKPTWDDGSEPQKLKERMERPLREHCILATVILGARPTIFGSERSLRSADVVGGSVCLSVGLSVSLHYALKLFLRVPKSS